MLKYTLTAAVLAAVLATPAFAQQPMTPDRALPIQSTPGRDTFVRSQHATDWRGSKLIGALVYGPDNASIGTINDVLFENSGKLRAVVIGVGGFLGVGEKNVAVPFEALNISRRPEASSIDKINVSYSKDDLKNAPKFAYYEPEKMQTSGAGLNDKLIGINPISKTSPNK